MLSLYFSRTLVGTSFQKPVNACLQPDVGSQDVRMDAIMLLRATYRRKGNPLAEVCPVLQAAEAAQKAGKSPDTLYCLELLQETGILTVPGGICQSLTAISVHPAGCLYV